MGFFSWKTSDTNKSVQVGRSQNVFLIQPDGAEPIVETCYSGYGEFGGVDAYLWLFEHNNHQLKALPDDFSEEQKRNLAISWAHERVLYVKETGEYFSDDSDAILKYLFDMKTFGCGWNQPIEMFNNQSANDFIVSGLADMVCVKDIVPMERPLKLSFNRNASYEYLAPSEVCSEQGVFALYGEPEDEFIFNNE